MKNSEPGGSAERSRRRLKAYERRRERALNVIRTAAPELFAPGIITFEKDRLEAIEAQLDGAAAEFSAGFGRNVLTQLLEEGVKKHRWIVKTWPSTVVNLRPAANPFTAKQLHAAKIFSRVCALHQVALDASITTQIEIANADSDFMARRAGQLVFSAIVSGGLVLKSCLDSLHSVISKPIWLHGSLMWFDFETPLPAEAKGRPWLRRWIPDPVTSALILRWRLDGCRWPELDGVAVTAKSVTDSYLRSVGFRFLRRNAYESVGQNRRAAPGVPDQSSVNEKQWFLEWRDVKTGTTHAEPEFHYSSTWRLVLDASFLRLRLKVPQLLADFATTENYSCSLPIEAWLRSLTGRRIPTSPLPSSLKKPTVPSGPSISLAKSNTLHADQRVLLRRLKECLKNIDRSKVSNAEASERLEALLPDFEKGACGFLADLLVWVHWCLNHRNVGDGVLKPVSVLRYLNYFAKALLATASDLDWRTLDAEDFNLVYAKMLESFDTAIERAVALEHVAEFHEFLVEYFERPSIAFAKNGTPVSAPHANIVTEPEFKLILKILSGQTTTTECAETSQGLAIIGYRCGLRRDEAAARVLQDVGGFAWNDNLISVADSQLYIHATTKSSIKYPASRRRLPLNDLVPGPEREMLDNFCWTRRERTASASLHSELLFTAEGKNRRKISDGEAFDHLSELIREVTGDHEIHFHQLRHSFATFMMARLLAAGIVVRKGDPRPCLPLGWEISDDDSEIPSRLSVERLGERLLGSRAPLRESAFLVSTLLGHVDPRESVQTYIHGFDWLLYRYLTQDVPTLSQNFLARLLNLTRNAAGVWRMRNRKALAKPDEDASSTRRTPNGIFDAEILDVVERLASTLQKTQPRAIATLPADEPFEIAVTNAEERPQFRPLTTLNLHESRNFAAKLHTSIFWQELAVAYRLDLMDAECLVGEFNLMANRETQYWNLDRRRPRNHKTWGRITPRDAPDAGASLTFDYSRALPLDQAELKEAESCFEALMTNDAQAREIRDALYIINTRISRSNPEFYFGSADPLIRAIWLLEKIGIGHDRLKISICSWYEDKSPGVLADDMARLLGVPASRITVRTPLKRSRNKPNFGQVALTVIPAQRSAKADRKSSSSHGWKIACYYAEALIAASLQAPVIREEREAENATWLQTVEGS